MTTHKMEVPEGTLQLRLDLFLAQAFPQYSRSQIQKWIKHGHILVTGAHTEASRLVTPGMAIEIIPPMEELGVVPEKMKLSILYEDHRILVVNKPAGQVSHPAAKNFKGTLLNAAAYHLKRRPDRKESEPGSLRAGLAHRLDKGTSGVLVIAKDSRSLKNISTQFEKRTIEKVYRAVVCGSLKTRKGEITGAIGKDFGNMKMVVTASGRYARTDYKVVRAFPKHTYLEAYPKTGRTHQIRVHLSEIGNPILGDPLYSEGGESVPRMMLHSYKLTLAHPETGKKLTFTAPVPKDFEAVLKTLTS